MRGDLHLPHLNLQCHPVERTFSAGLCIWEGEGEVLPPDPASQTEASRASQYLVEARGGWARGVGLGGHTRGRGLRLEALWALGPGPPLRGAMCWPLQAVPPPPWSLPPGWQDRPLPPPPRSPAGTSGISPALALCPQLGDRPGVRGWH